MTNSVDPIDIEPQTEELSPSPIEEKKWFNLIHKLFPPGKKLDPKIFLYGSLGLIFILGVIASTSTNKPSSTSSTPTPTAIPTLPPNINQENPISNKTFINTKFGFSFTHPGLSDECCYITGPMVGSIEVIGNLSDPATVSRGSDKPFDGFSMFVIDLGNLTADEYMKLEVDALKNEYFKKHQEEPRNSSWQTLTIADQPTILLKNYSSLTINKYYIQFPQSNKLLYIGANEEKLGSFDTTLNQILNSFSFNTSPEN
jgi:hypothetical protein